MPFKGKSLNRPLTILFLLCLFLSPASTLAQEQELFLKISDTTDYPGESVTVPVFITNYNDTIAGFVIRFTLSDEIVAFQPAIITTGTVIQNWEVIDVRPDPENPLNLQVLGIADSYIKPMVTPGLPPHAGQKLLFKLLLNIQDIPDTVQNRTVSVEIISDITKTNFSSSDFRVIGLASDTTYDTLWFNCASWFFDSCVTWVQVPGPPADYMYVDSNIISWLDTTKVIYQNGSLTVKVPLCGDINGDLTVDITDITGLIGFLYLGNEPPVCQRAANTDGTPEGTLDISDITRLIQHLYINGAELLCPD